MPYHVRASCGKAETMFFVSINFMSAVDILFNSYNWSL